jgi:hypothetical protein
VVVEGDHATVCVQTGFEMMPASGSIEVVAHVIFAGPEQLHRFAGFACDPGGFSGKVES